jgi:hypothetical protein
LHLIFPVELSAGWGKGIIEIKWLYICDKKGSFCRLGEKAENLGKTAKKTEKNSPFFGRK